MSPGWATPALACWCGAGRRASCRRLARLGLPLPGVLPCDWHLRALGQWPQSGGCDPASCVQAPGWGRGPQNPPVSRSGSAVEGSGSGLLSSPNPGVWVDRSSVLFLSGPLGPPLPAGPEATWARGHTALSGPSHNREAAPRREVWTLGRERADSWGRTIASSPLPSSQASSRAPG